MNINNNCFKDFFELTGLTGEVSFEDWEAPQLYILVSEGMLVYFNLRDLYFLFDAHELYITLSQTHGYFLWKCEDGLGQWVGESGLFKTRLAAEKDAFEKLLPLLKC